MKYKIIVNSTEKLLNVLKHLKSKNISLGMYENYDWLNIKNLDINPICIYVAYNHFHKIERLQISEKTWSFLKSEFRVIDCREKMLELI
jgi:hypothetical protein